MTNEKRGETVIPVSPLGSKAMLHSLNHAPTKEEGKQLVRIAFRHQRMDRYIQSRAADIKREKYYQNQCRLRGEDPFGPRCL